MMHRRIAPITTSNRVVRTASLLSVFFLLVLAGCASVPTDYERTESRALEDYQSTRIWQVYADGEKANPGKSGLGILRYGHNAFLFRIGMIDDAQKSIDLQVYIWQADETGRILAERLVRAADRGVRVRLLVDDMGSGATDEGIASIDAHPNIEVRMFNPFADRGSGVFDFVTDFNRVNHRMHNKIIIADNSFAVVGGRNVGDHYFAVDPETNFRDLDVAAVGPVVREISNVFDHFWASDWSVPITVLVDRQYTQQDLEQAMAVMRERIGTGNYPYSVDRDVKNLRQEIRGVLEESIVWAPAMIVWDDPEETVGTDEAGEIMVKLLGKLDKVEESLTIESAYFVIGDGGVERLRALVERGVRVRILTNSLASNDVLAAHAGHANYRKALVEAGVELYEFRPDASVIKKTWVGESRAGLHTKAFVFDDESLFIGSFNLDPRSANINTEAGLYAESPELARQLREYMDEGVLPQHAYRLTLDEDGDLVWSTENEGVAVQYHKDPMSTWWQRFMSGFIGILPVESQL